MGVLADEIAQESSPAQEVTPSSNGIICQTDVSPCSNANPSVITGKYFDIKSDYANNPSLMGYCRTDIGGVTYPPSSTVETANQVNFIRSRGCKKEKKRTECINSAFSELRRRIPNVPLDTKLSKIKTLRLATSYISHLTDIVRNADPGDVRDGREFHADLKTLKTKEIRRDIAYQKQTRLAESIQDSGNQRNDAYGRSENMIDNMAMRKKGRTGWPEAVWAMELENISPSSFEQNRSSNNPEINVGVTNQPQPQSFTNVYSNPSHYPCTYGSNSVANGHRSHNATSITNPYGNALLGYSIIPSIRENRGCPTESMPTYEEFLPYFPYTPVPLPGASSFSKRYTQFHSSNESIQNSHLPKCFQNVSPMDMGNEFSPSDYNAGYPNRFEEQNYAVEHDVQTGYQSSTMIAEITVIPNEAEDKFLWEPNGEELPTFDETKPTKFAELKTVSAASIRIATSTVNGHGIFAPPGRQDLQCFGATRVMEMNNVA